MEQENTNANSSQSVNDDGFEDDDEWDETLAQINLNLRPEDAPKPPPASGHAYSYRNVPIQFPYRAYKSQRQMMDKIIEGVTTGTNCLLESPTGTGKTAALLCSLLGWQRDCYARKDNCVKVIEDAAEKMGGCSCGLIKDKERTKVIVIKKKNNIILRATTTWDVEQEEEISPNTSKSTSKITSPVTTPTKVIPPPSSSVSCPCPSTSVSTTTHCHLPVATENAPSPRKRQKKETYEVQEKHIGNACSYCVRKNVVDKSRPPRIYYCTRTHSQIAQVIKQLKVTAYKNARMTILAGREPTCINENILKIMNPIQQSQSQQGKKEQKLTIDDYCRTLKKNYFKIKRIKENSDPEDFEKQKKEKNISLPPACEYFRPKNELEISFAEFQSRGAWDLEEIKNEGLECENCPFFGAHALQDSSDIIFGSYNYLLQPNIRDLKEIKYINSVLVFDEAHNIEDICRNVFSFSIDLDIFDRSIKELVDYMLMKASEQSTRVKATTVKNLQFVSVTFNTWSDKIKEWGQREVERRGRNKDKIQIYDISKPYESDELKAALVEMNMTKESVSDCLRLIGGDEEGEFNASSTSPSEEDEYYFDEKGVQQPFKLSSKVAEFLKKINQTFQYVFKENTNDIGGIKDFKGYLTGTANPTRKSRPIQSDDSRRNRVQQSKSNTVGPEFFFKFEIICLNPAVGFRRLRNTAYSIIVASGTLTPLNSFASELDTKFEVTLQADHVIPTSNVWAGVISTGPSNQALHLTRDRQEDKIIQDDIGRIICDICYTVPNGVLVFFPSYTLMRKLEDRWRTYPQGNSIFDQIKHRKMLFFEESKDKKAFKLNMESYKENVKGGPTWDGCVLFAVFRGKISEGIDFADEQARAVVTIGIPYSNAGAAEIVSKKNYNTMRKKALKPGETFLSGSEWYTTQAFRAMNQGFGRCVRHCEDWGALILIDSRLASHSNDRYISGWIRKGLQTYNNLAEAKPKLLKFTQDMKARKRVSRDHIQIAYDDDDLECTEIIQTTAGSFDGMNSQDDLMLTQIAALHDVGLHNMTTQQVFSSTPFPRSTRQHVTVPSTPLPVHTQRIPLSSTPVPQVEITSVAESSPEYSFTEEIDEVLGSLPSPVAPIQEANNSTDHHDEIQASPSSDSSASVFERTSSNVDSESEHDSDREMFDIADRLQESVHDRHSQTDDRLNRSVNLDVSMPSASDGNSEKEMSQISDISYHSDWDASLN